MPTDDGLILLYTALTKPSYLRGLLDALSYPDDHIVRYSYRRKNIHRSLLSVISKLDGRKGLIVFVDTGTEKNVAYYPSRYVEIQKTLDVTWSEKSADDRERLYLPLRLGGFVRYNPDSQSGTSQWHDAVKGFDRIREIEVTPPGSADRPKYFVIEGKDVFAQSSESSGLAWEDLVSNLAESEKLKKGVFLRLNHLREHALNKVVEMKKGDRLIYSILPAKEYRLDFSVFEKHSPDETHVNVRTTNDILVVDRPFQSVVSGLVERSVLIACKRTIESALVTVNVSVSASEDATKVAQQSPNPIIFLQVSPSKLVLFGFAVSALFGSFLVSADAETVQQLWQAFRLPYYASSLWLVRSAGAILFAYAAWIGFRKLPPGG